MRAFFLDLASNHGLLACCTREKVLAKQDMNHRVSDAELLPLVRAVTEEAGWQMGDLTKIVCVTGPGGFTSLRVGVALANAMAWGLQIPAAGIHLRDLWLARAGRTDVRWLHSTKKDLLFVGHPSEEPEVVALDVFVTSVRQGWEFTGELLPEHEALVTAKGALRVRAAAIEEVLPAVVAAAQEEQKGLAPWYGRGW